MPPPDPAALNSPAVDPPGADSAATPLFHIVADDVWAAAVESGLYHPESLDAEGFVHCSFADQVAGTASRYYAGVDGLLVVEFDPTRLPEVRVEDSYGSGTSFPHVYGPISSAAAVGSWPLEDFIAPAADASPDR